VRLHVVQAQLQRGQGRLAEAAATLDEAASRARQALPLHSGAEARLYLRNAVANALLTQAQILDHAQMPNLQQADAALHAYAQAEQVLREMLRQTDDLEALDRAAAEGDASTEVYVRHQLAVLLGGRALVMLRQGRADDAATAIDEAVALHQGNVQREPHAASWRDGLMCESATQSRVRLLQGRVAEALEASTRAVETLQALAAEAGPQSKWAGARTQALMALQHGRALVAAGRAAEGHARLREALASSTLGPADAAAAQALLAGHGDGGGDGDGDAGPITAA
jgi:tetratricopeptide (TPR) repeat protein